MVWKLLIMQQRDEQFSFSGLNSLMEAGLSGSFHNYARAVACLLVFLCPAVFSAPSPAAQNVIIMRDGSLVFEQPGERSAVLDILPRGASVELVDRGPVWCEIILRNPTRRGFIRADALTPAPESEMQLPERDLPSAAPPAPKAAVPLPAGSDFENRMRALDGTEQRIRELDRSLIEINGLVDTLNLLHLQQIAGGTVKRSSRTVQEENSREQVSDHPRLAANALAAYFPDSREILAGAGILWRPSALHGMSLELNAGYLIPDDSGVDGSFLAETGALLPLGLKYSALRPYLAVSGGIVRRDPGVTGVKARTDMLVSAGAGTFIELSSRSMLRIEARQSMEFLDGDRHDDQRIGIVFTRWF